MGHEDNGLDDFHVLAGCRDVLNKGAIDFQGVERQALEVGQGRIAGAEIVDGQ